MLKAASFLNSGSKELCCTPRSILYYLCFDFFMIRVGKYNDFLFPLLCQSDPTFNLTGNYVYFSAMLAEK